MSLNRFWAVGGLCLLVLLCWSTPSASANRAAPPFGRYDEFVHAVVSSGADHACALRPDATVVCWGSNNYNESSPPSGTFVQIDSGIGFTCGIRSDGTLACWGYDFQGQTT